MRPTQSPIAGSNAPAMSAVAVPVSGYPLAAVLLKCPADEPDEDPQSLVLRDHVARPRKSLIGLWTRVFGLISLSVVSG